VTGLLSYDDFWGRLPSEACDPNRIAASVPTRIAARLCSELQSGGTRSPGKHGALGKLAAALRIALAGSAIPNLLDRHNVST
jgi:hypothetical protein